VLTPRHIYQEDGIWVIDIKGDLKTQYRPRKLPMHSAILWEGFLDYVAEIRRLYRDARRYSLVPIRPLASKPMPLRGSVA
jgi:hypothetical protein